MLSFGKKKSVEMHQISPSMNSKKFQIISQTFPQLKGFNIENAIQQKIHSRIRVKDGTFFHLLFTIFESILQVELMLAYYISLLALLLILHPAKKDAIFC